MMGSFSNTQQVQTVSLASVLSAPLVSRCEQVRRLLNESSNKELAGIYPVLVEDVFGFNGRAGWSVQVVTRSCHPNEFAQLRDLLSPTGPLFAAIYRLMADPHLTYEFPATCLPCNRFSGGQPVDSSPWPPGGGGGPAPWSPLSPLSYVPSAGGGVLLLTPFEFYLHHFAYFLLNPGQQSSQMSWSAPGDALYPTLLEDLLGYFLPCGAQWVPPLATLAIHHTPISTPVQPVSSPHRLLRAGSLLRQPSSPVSPGGGPGHFSLETWRSEALLRAVAAFWLDCGSRAERQPAPGAVQETYVPSHDHVRLVRMVVKHVHYFTNSPHHLPGLEEFKRQMQALLQKKMYTFLQHTFNHWPMDASFRLVLELWLSYLQPWRYTDYTNKNRSPGQSQREADRTVDPSWGRFVAENLLFYSTIFRRLLPRFHRMDLTGAKYAFMVYRVAKVFSQPGLARLVREAESALVDRRGQHSQLNSSVATGQHLLDLEQQGFTYMSMFDSACKQQIQTLLLLLSDALSAVQRSAASLESPSGGGTSLVSRLVRSVLGWQPEVTGYGETTPEENRRTQTHLENSIQLLANLYQLPVPERSPASPAGPSDSPSTPVGQQLPHTAVGTPFNNGLTPSALQSPLAGRGAVRPDSVLTPDGPELTQRGRQQLISGLCRPEVTYQGDPSLAPVQSHENATLVRALLALSSHINNTYGAELAALHARDNFWGYLARQFLTPPATYYHYVRVRRGLSTRQARHVPASINLRPLASYRLLTYLLIALMLLWTVGGFSLRKSVFLLLLVIGVVACCRAVVQMVSDRRQHPSGQRLNQLDVSMATPAR